MRDFIEKFKTALPYLLPQTVEKVKAQQQKFNIDQELKVSLLETHIGKQHEKIETQNQRIQFLENKLTSNGLSLNKMIAGLQSEFLTLRSEVSNTQTYIRHLDLDIDDLQKKTKTKPKPIREFR